MSATGPPPNKTDNFSWKTAIGVLLGVTNLICTFILFFQKILPQQVSDILYPIWCIVTFSAVIFCSYFLFEYFKDVNSKLEKITGISIGSAAIFSVVYFEHNFFPKQR